MGTNISQKSLQDLTNIKDEFKQERDKKETEFSDISKYINPDMGDWGNDNEPVRDGSSPDTGLYRYDSTAMNASDLSADGIEGYAFGRQNPWFKLALEDEDPRQKGNQQYLQIAEKQLYKQLNRSPFYDEGRLFVRSVLDYSTAVMFREQNVAAGIPIYRTMHLKRCYIGNNRYGEVDILFREYWLSPQSAAAEFTYARLPQRIQDAFTQNKVSKFKFTEYIFPWDRFDLDMDQLTGKAYFSVHVADVETDKDLKVNGYESRPFFVSRFTRSFDGGAWGTGSPGMLQLSNIKELNSMRRDRKKTSQRKANPLMKATEGMHGRIRNEPDGVTYVPHGEDFTFMNPNIDQGDLTQDMLEIKKEINDAYHTDFFLILTQNIDRIKTATEASGIQGEKAAILAAFFGRMGFEFHEPILEDLFTMEILAGRLPPPPRQLAGKQIKVDYISPLFQMQRRHLLLNANKLALAEIAAIAQMQVNAKRPPDVLDNIDFDAYVRHITDTYNMNETVVREMIDVQRMREGRIKQQQQIAQMKIGAMKQNLENERMKALADVAQKTGQQPLALQA